MRTAILCGVTFFSMSGCSCRGDRLVEVFACVPEVCDGRDNDCNGKVDDGLPVTQCGVGACEVLVSSCGAGESAACVPGSPSPERCDGVDNDCDGEVDEHLPVLTCGIGECRVEVPSCENGRAAVCTGGTPTVEVCDGKDNDCNGSVDDPLAPVSCGTGVCLRTVTACNDGEPPACVEGAPGAEKCDGLDNDCDGLVDEGVCLAPVVMCPASQVALAGTTISLVGTAIDESGTGGTSAWSLLSSPAGSNAQLAPNGPGTSTFSPDVAGEYRFQFCATDVNGRSSCCASMVTTTACVSPPVPPVSTACGTSWDGRPIVQFAPVPAALEYQLRAENNPTVLASASQGQNHLRPAIRAAAGGPPPGTATVFEVRACRVGEPACCSAPSQLSIGIVAECSTSTGPTATNVVLSEYVVNGEGSCPSSDCLNHDTCQAGESVEITNLSNCPVSLAGHHFAYRNASGSVASHRWMNFGPGDVIPPRGVYVAIRNRAFAPTCSAALPAESTGLYGLKISSLTMQGANLCSGWFNNTGGGMSELRVAPGTVAPGSNPTFAPTAAVARVSPYLPVSGSSPSCSSIGFDAVDSCGTVAAGTAPTTQLSPNQLGRLWHPCDAIIAPVPGCSRN